MADNQNPLPDLNIIINELMSEHCQGVEEVHLEPRSETVTNVEPETQPIVEELVEEERALKRQKTVRRIEEEETGSNKDFVYAEAKDLWNRLLAEKGFVRERGFRKLISPFYKIIEKDRLGVLLCTHGAWILCYGKGILCKHGGNERRFSIRVRNLGTLWAQKSQ